jgi:rhodanese-related sulfurtransferase
MLGFGKASTHQELSPHALDALLKAGKALVVDVREPDEFAAGHIPGAVNLPLSTFRPAQLPHPAGKQLVLNCLGGKRSGLALDKCAAAQAEAECHLAGGFGAWAKAGLPVER